MAYFVKLRNKNQVLSNFRQRSREKKAATRARESAERAVNEASAESEETGTAPEGGAVLEANVSVVAEEAPGTTTSDVTANAYRS